MPNPPHIPTRRCVVCRDSHPKPKLHRFFRDEAGQWQPDPKAKTPGRGAWLCQTCFNHPSTKELQRFFRNQAKRIEELLTTKNRNLGFTVTSAGGTNV